MPLFAEGPTGAAARVQGVMRAAKGAVRPELLVATAEAAAAVLPMASLPEAASPDRAQPRRAAAPFQVRAVCGGSSTCRQGWGRTSALLVQHRTRLDWETCRRRNIPSLNDAEMLLCSCSAYMPVLPALTWFDASLVVCVDVRVP